MFSGESFANPLLFCLTFQRISLLWKDIVGFGLERSGLGIERRLNNPFCGVIILRASIKRPSRWTVVFRMIFSVSRREIFIGTLKRQATSFRPTRDTTSWHPAILQAYNHLEERYPGHKSTPSRNREDAMPCLGNSARAICRRKQLTPDADRKRIQPRHPHD